jgi:KDO2-lipid IV(A) lauroyltransferase
MLFYGLYVAGYWACVLLPRGFCYWVARRLADLYSSRVPVDREAVKRNLTAVMEREPSPREVKEVFRHFAMYLVDFFRFAHLTPKKVRRWIRIEGVEHMEEALKAGKGAIGVTAHLGNFELAGAVLALLGFPVCAVVFTHQNSRVDAFFSRQRAGVGVHPIPVRSKNQRALFEASLAALRKNGILGLVGDRDFFGNGLDLPFFGRQVKIPRGPAAFALRTGAPIVPAFLVREEDGSYRFFLERPIIVPEGLPKEEAVRRITEQCVEAMSRAIRKYPTQWYLFQEFWRTGPIVIR